MSDIELDAIKALCAEFEIKIIPGNRYPGPMETRAVAALKGIRRNHGEAHLRIVLSTLTEAGSNGALLDAASLWATSDLCEACADWIESDPSSWFEAWDALPIGEIVWLLKDIQSSGKSRTVRFGAFYLALQNHRGGSGLTEVIKDGVDRKLFDLMNREASGTGYRRDTSAMLGKTILAAEKLMEPQAFGSWLQNECGISVQQAKRFAKLAKDQMKQQTADIVAFAPVPLADRHQGAA